MYVCICQPEYKKMNPVPAYLRVNTESVLGLSSELVLRVIADLVLRDISESE